MIEMFAFDFWGFRYEIPRIKLSCTYYVLTTKNGEVFVVRNGGLDVEGNPSLHRNYLPGATTVDEHVRFYNEQGFDVAEGVCTGLSVGGRH